MSHKADGWRLHLIMAYGSEICGRHCYGGAPWLNPGNFMEDHRDTAEGHAGCLSASWLCGTPTCTLCSTITIHIRCKTMKSSDLELEHLNLQNYKLSKTILFINKLLLYFAGKLKSWLTHYFKEVETKREQRENRSNCNRCAFHSLQEKKWQESGASFPSKE